MGSNLASTTRLCNNGEVAFNFLLELHCVQSKAYEYLLVTMSTDTVPIYYLLVLKVFLLSFIFL